jgi:hypothetical protein
MEHKFQLQKKASEYFSRCTVISKIFHWMLKITSIIKNWNVKYIYIYIYVYLENIFSTQICLRRNLGPKIYETKGYY